MAKARLSAGEMDQRITFQVGGEADNSLGERVKIWVNLAARPTVWAKVQPLRGREFFAASQAQQALDARISIYWRPDITPAMRLIWRGEPYDIVGEPINVDGGRHTLELMVVKGVRDGRAPSSADGGSLDFSATQNSGLVPVLMED